MEMRELRGRSGRIILVDMETTGLITGRRLDLDQFPRTPEECFVTATVDITETDAEQQAAKQDFCNKLRSFKKHWPAFRERMMNGMIDGRNYQAIPYHEGGKVGCMCPMGIFAELCGLEIYDLPVKADSTSPMEMWFRYVLPDMTPVNNARMAITLKWFDEYVTEQNKPAEHWLSSMGIQYMIGIDPYRAFDGLETVGAVDIQAIYQRRDRERELVMQQCFQQLSQMHIHSGGMMIMQPGRMQRVGEAFHEQIAGALELEEA